jgi:hypothetical protein
MAKKYAVNIENDRVVSTEIDGVIYQNLDQIQNKQDRARMRRMVANIFHKANAALSNKKEAADTGPDVSKIVFMVFVGVSALMFVIAILSAVMVVRMISNEQSASGNVVDMVQRKDSEGNVYYYPVVEIPIPDEKPLEILLTTGSWPPAYVIGQPVTVAYDPNQPRNARIRSFEGDLGMWTVTIITGLLGLAFSVATGFAYWMSKQQLPETEDIDIDTR